MKTIAAAAVLLLAGTAQAQTAPQTAPPAQPPAGNLTRDLNSRPPTIEEYLARPITPASPPASASPRTAGPVGAASTPPPASATPTPAPRPATTPPSAARSAPATTPPGSAAPSPATRPAVSPSTAPAPATPGPTPAPVTADPAVTVLNTAARAALPFSVDLPPGFEIVTGRPGPDFKVYTIRRGAKSFAMIYAGPASQFPIYSGQMVEATGRASVVATEDGVRHAMEHLFQREGTPREVHVWVMSLEGADRAMAEQIAQSVDVR